MAIRNQKKAEQFIIDAGIYDCDFAMSLSSDSDKMTLEFMKASLESAKCSLSLLK